MKIVANTKEGWKSPSVIVNILTVIIAIISIIATWGMALQQIETVEEQFEQQFNLLKEQVEREINASQYLDREFYNHTFGEVIIFYNESQTGSTRYELIKMVLNNSLSGGLHNVMFVVSPNIKNASQYAFLEKRTNPLGFDPHIDRYKGWLNNSIYTWEKVIPQNQELWVTIDLTWNTNWHPNRIDFSEFYFKMYACDRLIDLTENIKYS